MRCYYDQQVFMVQANGGISRYFFELIRHLGANDAIQPTLFAGFYLSRLPLRSLPRCRVLGLPRRFRIGALYGGVDTLCRAFNRRWLRRTVPDIYHPTYYRTAQHPRGTRMVVTVYDMLHEKFPQYFAADGTVEAKRVACAAADALICISDSVRRDLLGYYPELASKASVVYLAAGAEFSATLPLNYTAAQSSSPYALFVGARGGYKGFDVLLEAWPRIARARPDLRLICVGGGSFSPMEASEIERRGLSGIISQRRVDDTQLAELYRGAAVFIYPSRYEGFGLPVLEAMACGCPVVCCRASSLPEVGGSAAAYFEPGDATDLAAVVAGVLEDEARRTEMVRAGYEQRARFSWDECARQTLAVYQRCTA
ncbi:MAG: glycosyltransferase family 4 protein [Rhodospirillales bacterium]|nr:glycosyltransferase family 4 protein [Acetobacter sp.]